MVFMSRMMMNPGMAMAMFAYHCGQKGHVFSAA